jgi:hypothetical protein
LQDHLADAWQLVGIVLLHAFFLAALVVERSPAEEALL